MRTSPGIVRIAAGDRMVLELAEVPRERDVLGTRDVLVAEEHDLVLEQQRADFGDELGVARGDTQVHVAELGADRARQRFDLDGAARGDQRGGGCSRHVCCSFDVCGRCSAGAIADDAGALQVANGGPEILHGVVLRAAVVPDRDAVLASAEAHLELGDVCLADQVVEQHGCAGIRVLAEAHVAGVW